MPAMRHSYASLQAYRLDGCKSDGERSRLLLVIVLLVDINVLESSWPWLLAFVLFPEWNLRNRLPRFVFCPGRMDIYDR